MPYSATLGDGEIDVARLMSSRGPTPTALRLSPTHNARPILRCVYVTVRVAHLGNSASDDALLGSQYISSPVPDLIGSPKNPRIRLAIGNPHTSVPVPSTIDSRLVSIP